MSIVPVLLSHTGELDGLFCLLTVLQSELFVLLLGEALRLLQQIDPRVWIKAENVFCW